MPNLQSVVHVWPGVEALTSGRSASRVVVCYNQVWDGMVWYYGMERCGKDALLCRGA